MWVGVVWRFQAGGGLSTGHFTGQSMHHREESSIHFAVLFFSLLPTTEYCVRTHVAFEALPTE